MIRGLGKLIFLAIMYVHVQTDVKSPTCQMFTTYSGNMYKIKLWIESIKKTRAHREQW